MTTTRSHEDNLNDARAMAAADGRDYAELSSFERTAYSHAAQVQWQTQRELDEQAALLADAVAYSQALAQHEADELAAAADDEQDMDQVIRMLNATTWEQRLAWEQDRMNTLQARDGLDVDEALAQVAQEWALAHGEDPATY